MSADNYDVATQPGRPAVPDDRSRNLRRGWRLVTTLLLVGVFTEAVFAGAMLSGAGWARAAHAATAAMLIASTFAAGLVGLVTLRRIPHGARLAWTLLAMAALSFLQAAVGALSAKGANLLWIHVPLGVALVGIAALAVATARGLRE